MFETPRLHFKITSAGDVEHLQCCLNAREISDAIYFIPHPYTHEHAKDWIAKAQSGFTDKTQWLFSVYLKENGTYIGSINIHQDKDDAAKAEIGYWLSPSHWRKGYGSEMLFAAIENGFNILEFKTLFATVALDNEASQKMLEKHGFENIAQINLPDSNGERASYYYEIRSPE